MEVELGGELLDGIVAMVRPYSVGFMKLGVTAGQETARPIGSGTLVTVGSIPGVLTAAHVLNALPDDGEVGLVRYQADASAFQKQKIQMRETQKLRLGNPPFTQKGPDLAFLHLLGDIVGSLKATNNFFNLDKRQEFFLAADRPKPMSMHALVGAIEERTRELAPTRSNTVLVAVEALFGPGQIVKEWGADGFDLLDFEVGFKAGEGPDSYGGLSGGALWRIAFDRVDGTEFGDPDPKVCGVAFWESETRNGKRTVTCHGPKSIYDRLLAEVRTAWKG